MLLWLCAGFFFIDPRLRRAKGPDHNRGNRRRAKEPDAATAARSNEGDRAMHKVPRDWLERAARVYNSNADASKALGIAGGTFGRLCRQHKIETPFARHRRRRRDPSQP